jgi:hypothetical protein
MGARQSRSNPDAPIGIAKLRQQTSRLLALVLMVDAVERDAPFLLEPHQQRVLEPARRTPRGKEID